MNEVKTKKSGGFFKGFITSILLIVIIGGSAYVADSMFGYKIFDNLLGSITTKTDSTMNMRTDTTKNGTMNMGNSNSNNTTSIAQNNYSLQNGDSLDKTIGLVNDALKSLTLDPYASDATNSMSNMNGMQNTTDSIKQNTVQNPSNSTQGNTVVNIYPPNATNNTQTSTTNAMGNMGTTYDVTKMEQLHKGIYKVSIGIQLLGQLKDDLSTQAGQVVYDPNNPVQYYINQYNLTVLNKSNLTKAADYINAAGDLMNVNPYKNENGLVYDKDRMAQIHKGIFTMAEAVAEINKLGTNLTKQTVVFSTLAQNSYNAANMNMNMSTDTSTSSIFPKLDMKSIGNILLIVFVSAFILGILGFIFSLTKPKKYYEKPEITLENQSK